MPHRHRTRRTHPSPRARPPLIPPARPGTRGGAPEAERREVPGEPVVAAPGQGAWGSAGLPPPAGSSMGLARDARGSPGLPRLAGLRGAIGSALALPWLCLGSGRSWERLPSRGVQSYKSHAQALVGLPAGSVVWAAAVAEPSALQRVPSWGKTTPLRCHMRPKFLLWQWDGISKLQLVPGLAFFVVEAGFLSFFLSFVFPMPTVPTFSSYQEWQSWVRYPGCCHSGCVRRKWPLPAATDRVPRSLGAVRELMFPSVHPGSSDPLWG